MATNQVAPASKTTFEFHEVIASFRQPSSSPGFGAASIPPQYGQ
jgi:hypothetical protein